MPRIHGELLKLGFAVAQSSVAKYMVKRPGHLSAQPRAGHRCHGSIRRFGFDLLYAFVIVRLGRRDLVWIANETVNQWSCLTFITSNVMLDIP
jgi:hypothetical protein